MQNTSNYPPNPAFLFFWTQNTRLTLGQLCSPLSFQVVIQAPRKFAITRIMRYKVQMKATAPLLKLAQDDEAIGKWSKIGDVGRNGLDILRFIKCFLR